MRETVRQIVADDVHWQARGRYHIIRWHIGGEHGLRSREIAMKRAGFVSLLHMVMLRTGPDPISPYLLRTAIEGADAALVIDHAFMRLVDPSLYESLRPWLEFERNVSLPTHPALA